MTSTTQSTSRFPIPNWASILFSSFPLIQFEPATVYSQSGNDSNPAITTLFIQNPHPTSIPSWPSSDPISLKYQLELSLRGIQFKCKYLHQQDSFGGPLPFLILPNPPGISRPNLVKKKDLDRYLENYLPFDYERQELSEEDVEKENERRNPYKDEKLRLEAATWKYTLHREGLAGVLLASLFLTPTPPLNPNAGFLSRAIQSQSSTSQFTSSLSSIAHLSGLASMQASERAVTNNGWFSNVTWGGPAVISNGATNAISLPEEEEEEEVEEVEVGLEMRDEIIQKSVELIEAIGRRDEQIDGEGDWFFGASSPTSLDAILFSILHTILSLPQPSFASSDLSPLHQEGLKMSSRLRKAVESHPRLMKWTRNVWEKQVRDKKVEEIDLLSR